MKFWKWIKRHYEFIVFLIILIVLIVIAVRGICCGWPRWLWDTDNEINGKYVTLVSAIIGGVLVLFGLYINDKRVKAMLQQNKIAENGQINTRFKDAVEMLGKDKTSSNLSGIYVFEQIIKETYNPEDKNSFGYRDVIYNVLCSYIEDNSELPDKILGKGTALYPSDIKKPVIITQAIVDLLFKTMGRNVVLNNSVFNHNKFEYKKLMILSKCVLANCNFKEIEPKSKFWTTFFLNVTFEKPTEGVFFFETDMHHVNFKENIGDIQFVGSTLEDVEFNSMQDVSFLNNEIRNCKFNSDSELSGINFSIARLSHVTFSKVRLLRVDFQGARLEDVNFSNTVLEGFAIDDITNMTDDVKRALKFEV